MATNGRIPISEILHTSSGKRKFQPDNRNDCENYNDNDDDEWLLEFNKKGNVVYVKHCKVLIDPIAESKDKKKGRKTYKKVIHVETEVDRQLN